jgi:hypothetical protein
MRPYSGIGVFKSADTVIHLYDEPGLIRCCSIDLSSVPDIYTGVFCTAEEPLLLVFSVRNDWLLVEYDDAGRQGWIQTARYSNFQPWPDFLKGKSISFLRSSPKKFLFLTQKPEADAGVTVLYNIPMRTILVQDDWAFVIINPQLSGWIRWRDPDGRLLVSVNCAANSSQNR